MGKSTKIKRVAWTINGFPTELKNRFVGLTKMIGSSTRVELEALIKKFVEEKSKDLPNIRSSADHG